MCLDKIDTEGRIEKVEEGWQVCIRGPERTLAPIAAQSVFPWGIRKQEGEWLEASNLSLNTVFADLPYVLGFHVFKAKAAALWYYKHLRNDKDNQKTLKQNNIRLVIKKVLVASGSVKTCGWQWNHEVMVAQKIFIPPLTKVADVRGTKKKELCHV